MRSPKYLFSIIVIAMLAIVPAACGGGGSEVSADADPQEVLNQTFGPEGAIESANLNAEISIDQQGSEADKLDVKLSGPVQETESEVPSLDLTLDMTGQMGGDNIDFSGGLTLVDETGYVTLDGDSYELNQSLVGQVKSQAAEAQSEGDGETDESAGILGGLNPESFLTDLTNEGTTEIDGEQTVHVSGTVDTEAATSELQEVMTGAAALQGLGVDIPGAREFRELEETIGNIRFDIYTGADDSLLRRMEFSVPVEGDNDSGSLAVSVNLTDVNEDLEVTAPENAKPFSQLIGALASGGLEGLGIEGLSELGDLGSIGSTDGSSSDSDGSSGSDGQDGDASGAEGSGSGAAGPSSEAFECLQNAQSAADVAECTQAVQ